MVNYEDVSKDRIITDFEAALPNWPGDVEFAILRIEQNLKIENWSDEHVNEYSAISPAEFL